MKTVLTTVLLGLFLVLSTGPTSAAPRKKVIYSEGSSTRFVWQWPYHPKRTKTYVQTKPYYATARIIQRYAGENVSKYRFHYQHKAPQNEWGYYFAPGTKLNPKMPIQFGPIEPQHRVRAIVPLSY